MVIQIIIVLFALFVLIRILMRFRKREISLKEFLFWLVFWTAVVIVTVFLRETDFVAQYFGVERAADLVVYLSILIIFYTIFRVYVRIDRIERNISKIITAISFIKKKEDK